MKTNVLLIILSPEGPAMSTHALKKDGSQAKTVMISDLNCPVVMVTNTD